MLILHFYFVLSVSLASLFELLQDDSFKYPQFALLDKFDNDLIIWVAGSRRWFPEINRNLIWAYAAYTGNVELGGIILKKLFHVGDFDPSFDDNLAFRLAVQRNHLQFVMLILQNRGRKKFFRIPFSGLDADFYNEMLDLSLKLKHKEMFKYLYITLK